MSYSNKFEYSVYTLLRSQNAHVPGKMKREEILKWQIWYVNKQELCPFTLVI